jgi:SAM-dependent methyltransferase
MFRYAALLVFAAALLACSPPTPGATAPAPVKADVLNDSGAPASFFPAPDRPVAPIVSDTWNHPEKRDAADESGQLIRALGIGPGMVIGDIGAGSGYHTVRMSPVVGPTGRIIAQDIKPEYLRGLSRTLQERGISNVKLAVGEAHDPRLAPDSLDLALMVHMYHEIAQPYAFLHNLAPAMKRGGRVAVVDLDRETWKHGTPRDLLRCEMEAVGYRQISFATLGGEVGYLAVFTAPSEDERPEPGAIRPCRPPAR